MACVAPLVAAAPGLAQHDAPGLSVNASWLDLESGEIVVRHPRLRISALNREQVPLRARLEIAVSVDGEQTRVLRRSLTLKPQQELERKIALPIRVRDLRNQRFSGRVDVTLDLVPRRAGSIEMPEGPGATSASLPELWFHAENGRLHFYDAETLRQRYAGGNFRGEALALPDFEDELDRTLVDALPPGSGAVLYGVGLANTSPIADPIVLPPNARRYCIEIDGGAYYDSTTPAADHGEDIGTGDQYIAMARAWVSIAQNGGHVFSGHLDGEGCTPVVSALPAVPVLVVLAPLYHAPVSHLKMVVTDQSLEQQLPHGMPYFVLVADTLPGPRTRIEVDRTDRRAAMYAAASGCLERASAGRSNLLYELSLALPADTTGTHTFYADEGHTRVHVKHAKGAFSKFSMCHEYSHALLLAELQPPMPFGGIDYAPLPDSAPDHKMKSLEWNLAAAVEGFAHFLAATVWNHVTPGGDGVFVLAGNSHGSSTPFELGQFEQAFLNEHGAPGHTGMGTELDWAQMFWHWHADDSGIPPPTMNVLVEIFHAAWEPWLIEQGFFQQFRDAALDVLPSHHPNLPLEQKIGRLDAWRTSAGIID